MADRGFPRSYGGEFPVARTLGLVGGLLVLRLPTWLEPPWYVDEGVYATVAMAMRSGDVLYRDTWDNKPPGVFLWFAAVQSVGGTALWPLRVALTAWIGATAWLLLRLGRMVDSPQTGWWAAWIWVVVSSLAWLEGDKANSELLAALPLAAAATVGFGGGSPRRPFLAGLLGGIASALQFPAAIPAVALVACAALPGRWSSRGGRVMAGLLGLVVPWLLLMAWLGLSGGLGDFLRVILGSLPHYVASSNGGRATFGLALFARWGLVVALTAAWWLLRRPASGELLIGSWLAASVLAATVSGLGLSHYGLTILPPLALVLGAGAHRVTDRLAPTGLGGLAARGATALAVVVLACLLVPGVALAPRLEVQGLSANLTDQNSFRLDPVGYWSHSLRYLLGRESYRSYATWFDREVPAVEGLARSFAAAPPGRVYVWGYAPWSYPLSRRLPACRYPVHGRAYYAIPEAPRQCLADLDRHHPTLVAIDAHQQLPPDVQDALLQRFTQVATQGRFTLLAPRAP